MKTYDMRYIQQFEYQADIEAESLEEAKNKLIAKIENMTDEELIAQSFITREAVEQA